MVVLPWVGLPGALNGIREREGVKVFGALNTLALGVSKSVGKASAGGNRWERVK